MVRRLALASPWALLSTLLRGDIQNQEKKGGCRAKVEVAGCYSLELPESIFKYGEVPRNGLFRATQRSYHEYICINIHS